MEEAKQGGYIYILTNPSFEQYVKIGFSKNVKQRLDQLNRNEGLPFAFRIYATYYVDRDLGDTNIHDIIDKLNPELRSVERFEGKERKREFYAMSPEDAYDILKAMAELHGTTSRLKCYTPTAKEKMQEEIARQIEIEHRQRGEVFSFEKCHIPVGAELEFINDKNIKCYVYDDRKIRYNNEVMYTTTLAKMLTGKKTIAGPLYFSYNGKNLQKYYEEFQVNKKD